MRYSTITYEVTGAVAIISLNRPDVRNCISLTMTTELDAAFTAACRDHAVRVMVLRAVGPNFSSGVRTLNPPRLEPFTQQSRAKCTFVHGKTTDYRAGEGAESPWSSVILFF